MASFDALLEAAQFLEHRNTPESKARGKLHMYLDSVSIRRQNSCLKLCVLQQREVNSVSNSSN